MRLRTPVVTCGIAVLCAAVAGVSARSQQRDAPPQPSFRQVPVGTASVVGQVIDAQTGQPVAQARVSLSGMTSFGLSMAAQPPGVPPPGVTTGRGSVGVSAGLSVVLPGAQQSMSMVSSAGGSASSVGRTFVTDAQGRFVFNHLPAGKFNLTVAHRAYLNGGVGQRRPGGQTRPLDVTDGHKVDVAVKLVRGGVISGTAYDESGAPLVNARVQAWRRMPSARGLIWQGQGSVTTDDRGLYRLHGLQPGDYAVSVQPQNVIENDVASEEAALIDSAVVSGAVQAGAPGQPSMVRIPVPANQRPGYTPQNYLPTFAPNAMNADAGTKLTLTGGDEHGGIDIHFRRLRASTISGMVTNLPPAQPNAPSRVQVMVHSESSPGWSTGTSANPDGRFMISNLTPGTYTVIATYHSGNAPMAPQLPASPPAVLQKPLSTRTTVNVSDEEATSIVLDLQPGRSVSGQVSFDMMRPLSPSQTITVRLSNVPGEYSTGGSNQLSATVDGSGRFTIADVLPGRYMVSASAPVRSAELAGIDTLDSYIEVTGNADVNGLHVVLSDRMSMVSGQITASGDYDATEYTIVIVSTDPQHWRPYSRRVIVTRANLAGRYLANVPPGSYAIGLVVDFESGAQNDPEFLRALVASGAGVTVNLGDRVTRDLRAGG